MNASPPSCASCHRHSFVQSPVAAVCARRRAASSPRRRRPNLHPPVHRLPLPHPLPSPSRRRTYPYAAPISFGATPAPPGTPSSGRPSRPQSCAPCPAPRGAPPRHARRVQSQNKAQSRAPRRALTPRREPSFPPRHSRRAVRRCRRWCTRCVARRSRTCAAATRCSDGRRC